MGNHDKALIDVRPQEESTLLIGFKEAQNDLFSGEESLKELRALADTAGAKIKQELMIKLSQPDPSFYLGKGKVEELALYVQEEEIDLLIFDNELSPRQQNNLQERIGARVIDRTALILQIFANRAKTKEGILQVELAQLNYLLPRLSGMGTQLSRLGGGIGTRGPGETKLETDRRHIRRRIGELERKIKEIKKQRGIIRQKRTHENIPVVALVGYTNAGKSTILNALTKADTLAENKLFATLDPTTRKLTLNDRDILLTDTVGFIHKLPHQLIAAFRATLEEIKYADLLLHVVDASNPALLAQIETVNQVLKELGCSNKPTIVVFNKWDLVNDPLELQQLLRNWHPAVAVSALYNNQLSELLSLVSENLPQQPQLVELLLPYEESALTNFLYQVGKVMETEYRENGIYCAVYLAEKYLHQLPDYLFCPTNTYNESSNKEKESSG